MKNFVNAAKAPAAVGTYSQGVELNGVYYFSGMLPLDPSTMEVKTDVQEQIDQILSNIDGLLEGCNITRKNIIKTTVFLTDLKDFGMINAAYEKYFEKPYPARSCVQVAALPRGVNVEIEVIAHK